MAPRLLLPGSSVSSLVGLGRLELPTSPLSGVRSNHLSYRPNSFHLVAQANSINSNECEYSCLGYFFKEVIQPQVPLRLPCYDFTPVIGHTVDGVPLSVRLPASGATDSHGVTGGVYKARERIHRSMLICDY